MSNCKSGPRPPSPPFLTEILPPGAAEVDAAARGGADQSIASGSDCPSRGVRAPARAGARHPRRTNPSGPHLPVPAQSALEQTIGLKWSGWIGAVVVVIGVRAGHRICLRPEVVRHPAAGRAAGADVPRGVRADRRGAKWSSAAFTTSRPRACTARAWRRCSSSATPVWLLPPLRAADRLPAVALSTVAVRRRRHAGQVRLDRGAGGRSAATSPILLRSDHPRLVPFLAYLLTLQLVALTLAWWGGAPSGGRCGPCRWRRPAFGCSASSPGAPSPVARHEADVLPAVRGALPGGVDPLGRPRSRASTSRRPCRRHGRPHPFG